MPTTAEALKDRVQDACEVLQAQGKYPTAALIAIELRRSNGYGLLAVRNELVSEGRLVLIPKAIAKVRTRGGALRPQNPKPESKPVADEKVPTDGRCCHAAQFHRDCKTVLHVNRWARRTARRREPVWGMFSRPEGSEVQA